MKRSLKLSQLLADMPTVRQAAEDAGLKNPFTIGESVFVYGREWIVIEVIPERNIIVLEN